ncbi:NfeD family protein [Parachlamydia sp. AcF125]|uniref:NfeD family protein n=1 Tax=Parachlamydia sp. AcF125 TaxID=2795736 RepID=UPI001BCA1A6A|nr:NfeD family protein [Parachlamydia sp. AcF125]MBS4168877.1 hypothetical protein [Parachlamydia sp. AcF125]
MLNRVKPASFYSLILLFSIYVFSAFAQEIPAKPTWVYLKGHLDKDVLDQRKSSIDQAVQEGKQQFILLIDSSSGDLIEAFDLARHLYELKAEKKISLIVYIENSALGPAAVFPFLADALYCSFFTSWGDVALGSELVLPKNILRNRVVSLVVPENPHFQILQVLALGMTDPSVQIVDQSGWKLAEEVKGDKSSLISSAGEALVVNQNQLKHLELLQAILSLESFKQKMGWEQISSHMPAPIAPSISPLEISHRPLEESLKQHIPFNPHGKNQVGLIRIDDQTNGINQSTWIYVKNALDYYKKNRPSFIILELNTPGGEIFAAQKISDAFKEIDTQFGIPIVAYINNWAISAGAMLAYSCRYIAVVKDGSMGAAEPVIANESGQMQAASEKVNSALRADFANRARFFDRNPYLAEAMVDKDIILVLRHGKIVKLDQESQIRTTGTDPDRIITPKGKLLTLNSNELIEYGVADLQLLPQKLAQITDREKESGQWAASKMLLFHYPFFSSIPQASIDQYRMDWKTQFFVFLSHPVVSSALFLGLLMGAYMELSTPGFGFPGSIALVCLFLIILSSFALEIASWLELILLLAGGVMVILDLFVLPTFGLMGIFGGILLFVGLFGLMLPGAGSMHFEFDTGTFNAAGEAVMSRLAWLSGTLVAAVGLMMLLARYVTPSFSGFNRFVLKGHEQEGYQAFFISPELLPQPGKKGTAETPLRPAGKVMIDEKYYDAISNGLLIEKGSPIRVIGFDSGALVVEEESKA